MRKLSIDELLQRESASEYKGSSREPSAFSRKAVLNDKPASAADSPAAQGKGLGHETIHFLLWIIVFEVAYYLAYRYGMSFSQVSASPFWFPDSVLLCAFLLNRPARWWVFIVLAVPVRLFSEVAHGIPFWFLLTTFAIDAVKGVCTAAILRRVLGNPVRFETLREFALFCLFAALLLPAASAFAGAWARHQLGAGYLPAWEQWFLGDLLTQLVVTPVLLYWVVGTPWRRRPPPPGRLIEAGLLALGLILTAWAAFTPPHDETHFADSRFYAPVPFLFWAAIRFGMLGACGGIAVITFFSTEAALQGRGFFSGLSPDESARALQQFLLLRAGSVYLVAIVMEQKQAAENSLRYSEAEIRAIVRAIPDPMFLVTRTGICSGYHAPEAQELVMPPERFLGRHVRELLPADSAEELLRCFETLQGSGDHTVIEYVLPLQGSNRVYEAHIVRVGPDHLLVVARDMTDRKDAEEARQSLAHNARLAILGELTAMIAHEVNQPLGAILSNAEAAERLLDSREAPLNEVREILADIRKDDLRASDAIRGVRALLQKREMQMQSLDVNEVISNVLGLVTADALRRRVQIQREFGVLLPLVPGDAAHLQQVVLNLVLNAMDAVEKNGGAERRIIVRTALNTDRIQVSVQDSGPGIPGEQISRIFAAFFTTKPDGMGLGLSMARSIIEAHGGHIWAENSRNGGATFHFALPVRANTPKVHAATFGL